MKKLLILFLLLLPQILSAQLVGPYLRDSKNKKIIDTCRYSMLYKYKFCTDTTRRYPFFDKFVLEVGNKSSRYYSYLADQMDSVFVKSKGHGGISPHLKLGLKSNEKANYDDFYKDYPQKGLLTVCSGILQREFIYTESIPQMDWNIIQEQDTIILGYPCFKAELKFRGRKYYAWFTPQIPINEGPWKFQGLPGLILSVRESTGFFEWDIIEIKKSSRPIYTYAHDGVLQQKCSRKEYLKIQKLSWSDPIALSTSFGQKWVVGNSPGKPGDIKYPPIPALELE